MGNLVKHEDKGGIRSLENCYLASDYFYKALRMQLKTIGNHPAENKISRTILGKYHPALKGKLVVN